jgi:hypothetical protein
VRIGETPVRSGLLTFVTTILLLMNAAAVSAQTYIDREQVADAVFPPFAVGIRGPEYRTRFMLRFDDPDSQIVIATHADGNRTVELYRLDPEMTIWNAIGRAQRQNLNATVDQVASAIRVRKTVLAVSPDRVDRWLHELAEITPPLVLTPWIKEDQMPQLDLWVDSNGDSLHYRFYFARTQQMSPQNPLAPMARWMLKVRADIEEMSKKNEHITR